MNAPAVRHDRHRRSFPRADLTLLDLPCAQPIIKRVAASVPADYPKRMEQVLLVSAIAVAAKLNPTNGFAEATLHA